MRRNKTVLPALLGLGGSLVASSAVFATAALATAEGKPSADQAKAQRLSRAFRRVPAAADRVPARVRARLPVRVAAASSRRVLRATRNGVTRVVYVAPSADGKLLCLVASSTANDETGVSCSTPTRFSAGLGFHLLIRNDGDPAAPTTIDVIGVANAGVARIRASFGSVTEETVPLRDGGFWLSAGRELLSNGRLVAVTSVGPDGRVIGRLPVPGK